MNQSEQAPPQGPGPKLGLLPTPGELRAEFPIGDLVAEEIDGHRQDVINIMEGRDPRLLAVVGMCSLDSHVALGKGIFAATDFANQLSSAVTAAGLDEDLKLVIRAPVAKPRTDLGWAGLEQTDVRCAREALAELVNAGHSLAIEVMLERQFARFGDLLTLAWGGARNVLDTNVRHAISAHAKIPAFFKNAPDGSFKPALDAILTASTGHLTEVMDADGRLILMKSFGNPHVGLISRGGSDMSASDFIVTSQRAIATAQSTLIDCSHANAKAHAESSSENDIVQGQVRCAERLIAAIGQGILRPHGFMMESNLIAGKGNLRGQSKTDPCIGLNQTIDLLGGFAEARRQSR